MLSYRDCLLTDHLPGTIWVTACDSCGAIGEKPGDALETFPEIVGFTTARVALLEVLAMGAQVISAAVPIANEPDNTGERLIAGVNKCFDSFGIHVPMVFSTEKNMPTTMTAMGIAVNGVASNIRAGGYEEGDYIYIIGRPSVGAEVIAYEHELVSAKHIYALLEMTDVREILPVGSRGIGEELADMMNYWHFEFEILEGHGLDLNKSCGPATVAIVITGGEIESEFDIPWTCIGRVGGKF